MWIVSIIFSSLCAWQLGTKSPLLTGCLCVGRAPWQRMSSYSNDYVVEKLVTVTHTTIIQSGPPPVTAFLPSLAPRSTKTVAPLADQPTRPRNPFGSEIRVVASAAQISNPKSPVSPSFAAPAPSTPRPNRYHPASHSFGSESTSPIQKLEWYQKHIAALLQYIWQRTHAVATPSFHKAVITATSTHHHMTTSFRHGVSSTFRMLYDDVLRPMHEAKTKILFGLLVILSICNILAIFRDTILDGWEILWYNWTPLVAMCMQHGHNAILIVGCGVMVLIYICLYPVQIIIESFAPGIYWFVYQHIKAVKSMDRQDWLNVAKKVMRVIRFVLWIMARYGWRCLCAAVGFAWSIVWPCIEEKLFPAPPPTPERAPTPPPIEVAEPAVAKPSPKPIHGFEPVEEPFHVYLMRYRLSKRPRDQAYDGFGGYHVPEFSDLSDSDEDDDVENDVAEDAGGKSRDLVPHAMSDDENEEEYVPPPIAIEMPKSPKAVSPRPASPKAASPKPTSPKVSSPKVASPKVAPSKPASPTPASPKQVAPSAPTANTAVQQQAVASQPPPTQPAPTQVNPPLNAGNLDQFLPPQPIAPPNFANIFSLSAPPSQTNPANSAERFFTSLADHATRERLLAEAGQTGVSAFRNHPPPAPTGYMPPSTAQIPTNTAPAVTNIVEHAGSYVQTPNTVPEQPILAQPPTIAAHSTATSAPVPTESLQGGVRRMEEEEETIAAGKKHKNKAAQSITKHIKPVSRFQENYDLHAALETEFQDCWKQLLADDQHRILGFVVELSKILAATNRAVNSVDNMQGLSTLNITAKALLLLYANALSQSRAKEDAPIYNDEIEFFCRQKTDTSKTLEKQLMIEANKDPACNRQFIYAVALMGCFLAQPMRRKEIQNAMQSLNQEVELKLVAAHEEAFLQEHGYEQAMDEENINKKYPVVTAAKQARSQVTSGSHLPHNSQQPAIQPKPTVSELMPPPPRPTSVSNPMNSAPSPTAPITTTVSAPKAAQQASTMPPASAVPETSTTVSVSLSTKFQNDDERTTQSVKEVAAEESSAEEPAAQDVADDETESSLSESMSMSGSEEEHRNPHLELFDVWDEYDADEKKFANRILHDLANTKKEKKVSELNGWKEYKLNTKARMDLMVQGMRKAVRVVQSNDFKEEYEFLFGYKDAFKKVLQNAIKPWAAVSKLDEKAQTIQYYLLLQGVFLLPVSTRRAMSTRIKKEKINVKLELLADHEKWDQLSEEDLEEKWPNPYVAVKRERTSHAFGSAD